MDGLEFECKDNQLLEGHKSFPLSTTYFCCLLPEFDLALDLKQSRNAVVGVLILQAGRVSRGPADWKGEFGSGTMTVNLDW